MYHIQIPQVTNKQYFSSNQSTQGMQPFRKYFFTSTFLRSVKTPYHQLKVPPLFATPKSTKYVPQCNPIDSNTQQQIHLLSKLISSSSKLVILSGAGISTESGIPDYRSPEGSYAKGHRPIQYQEFVNNVKNRQRYWMRNMLGYKMFVKAQPNPAHFALVELEKLGKEITVVTQNVDNLHQSAGQKRVIDLHGNNRRVVCIQCNQRTSREELQKRLEEMNPTYAEIANKLLKNADKLDQRADGDAAFTEEIDYTNFKIPHCINCGGILKPDVVFFGENVERAIVEQVMQHVYSSDALLVCGTSLQVYSGYRFVKAAFEKSIPISAINIGPTRADHFFQIRIDGRCGVVLPQIVQNVMHHVK